MLANRNMTASQIQRPFTPMSNAPPSRIVAPAPRIVIHRSMDCLMGRRSAITPNPGERTATMSAATPVTSANIDVGPNSKGPT